MNMKKNVLSRREFLKECGLLVGATAVATSFPWMTALSEENQKATDGEKLRVAVIGPGSRGRYHLNFLVRNPKVEVTWLCDVYQPSLDKALAIAPGAKTCKDYREVLDDPEVDAIYVVTPLDTHKQITVDAFEAGKHVFCEKSLSHNCADALEMYNAHLRTGKVFFVGQQRLYDPYYLEAIRMIEEGMFGPIEGIKTFWYRNADWRREVPSPELERLINWRLYREHSCGLMTELACHQVQLGTWIYKDIPETIMGSGAITFWKDGREVEDNVNVIYTYKDGRRVSFESIISNKFYGLEEQIMGHLGTVEPEKGKYYFEQTPPMPGFLRMINDLEKDIYGDLSFAGPSWDPEIARQNHGEFILGRKRPPRNDGSGYLNDAFVEASLTGKQPPMVAEEGYYATIMSLLGQQAIDEKRIIAFPEEFKIDYNYR